MKSLPAARSASASRRSPQQIGFIPAQGMPDAQQMQKPHGNMGLSHAGVRPGNEEAHATCATRSDALGEGLARIVSIIDWKIFAPSALPSRASEARSG
jgi:hypothetical protein